MCLKVVSAALLLVFLKESTFETREKKFYFTSKALFVSKKSKFRIFDLQIS